MSSLVLSATQPIHGSNSTSSLSSLEQQRLDEEEDQTTAIHDNQTHPNRNTTILTINIDNYNDQDDEGSDSDVEDERVNESAIHKHSVACDSTSPSSIVNQFQLIAEARLVSGVSNNKDLGIELVHVTRELSNRKSCNSQIASFPIHLLNEHNALDGFIPPDTDDIYSLETFSSLHQLRVSQMKQLVIAEVTTKDPKSVNFTDSIHSYYDALPLLRTLFKKKGNDIQHRYHQYQTHHPLNPLTNTHIIGEVKFYMITDTINTPRTASNSNSSHVILPPSVPPSPASSTSSFHSSSESKVFAKFIGTDYNFAFCPTFRSLLIKQCPEVQNCYLATLDRLLQKPQKPARESQLGWRGPGANQLEALVESLYYGNEENDHRIPLPIAFHRAAVYGIVAALYALCALLIFEFSMEAIINNDLNSSLNYTSQWYFFALPVFSAITDLLTSILFTMKEHWIFLVMKLVAYVIYYLTPFYLFTYDEGLAGSRQIAEMCFPVLLTGYSIGLFIWRSRTFRLE